MIGFIGVGNMAGAIASGILKNNICTARELGLYDPVAEKAVRFAGARVYTSEAELVKGESIIFLAVKPNCFPDVLSSLEKNIGRDNFEGKTFVTIAAGISTEYIKRSLGKSARVVRVMPNTPMLMGKGICAVSRADDVDKEVYEKIKRIFSCLGSVREYDERQMNAIISLTSSSPAYAFLLAKAMAEGAAEQGFDADDSFLLAADVLEGAAAMIRGTGMQPQALIDMVTSKGGTTRAALDVFEARDFAQTVKDAMKACTKRADELAQ